MDQTLRPAIQEECLKIIKVPLFQWLHKIAARKKYANCYLVQYMTLTCHPPGPSVPPELPPLPVQLHQLLAQLLSKPVPPRLACVGHTALGALGHLARSQVRQGVVRSSKEWSGQARSGQVRQGVVRSGKKWSGQARSGQVRQGVVKSGKEWSGQAKGKWLAKIPALWRADFEGFCALELALML